MVKKLLLVIVGFLVLTTAIYVIMMTGGNEANAAQIEPTVGAAGCVTIAGHDTDWVQYRYVTHLPPHLHVFTIRMYVERKWDCHGQFLAGYPKYTKTIWQNNCLMCTLNFDHWLAPVTTHGGVNYQWEKRVQQAQFSLSTGVYTIHPIYGVWAKSGAWSVLVNGVCCGGDFHGGVTG